MQWQDQGIILSVRRFGETSVILDVLTARHGRHGGLVRGGRSKRLRAALQPGNTLDVSWRARLEDHLGTYGAELVCPRAALIMDDPAALAALSSFCALCSLLSERESHDNLYGASVLLLDSLAHDAHWPALMARWELGLLSALGFGLDLSRCAANGSTDDLVYVSPRSARAVSRDAGQAFSDKLLTLPAFLSGTTTGYPDKKDLHDAFVLSGYFLDRHVFGPRGLTPPDARRRMIEKIVRIK
jgi:DNA repair protein RecO (recombination protein O)